jgi:hypothetical protein
MSSSRPSFARTASWKVAWFMSAAAGVAWGMEPQNAILQAAALWVVPEGAADQAG